MRMRGMSKIVITLITVLLLMFTAACAPAVTEEEEEEVTPETSMEWGTIEIRVTDPPPADVKTAVVYLNNIEVHKVSGNTSGWMKILEAPPSFDLMSVIEVEKVLGSANVTAGSFTQIRMDVIKVTGNTTDNVSYTANVTGDKLKIVRPFNVGAGKVTVLTLDFDGEKSLIRTGSGEFLFKPVVKLLIEHDPEMEMELEQEMEMEQGEEQGQKREQEKEQEQGAEELKFEGSIVSINGTIWTMTIEGESRTVDVSEAEIKGEPALELQAEVEGTVVEDGTIMASEVEIKETE